MKHFSLFEALFEIGISNKRFSFEILFYYKNLFADIKYKVMYLYYKKLSLHIFQLVDEKTVSNTWNGTTLFYPA